MYKYLYIYNYSPHEKELCAMEFASVFQEPMISKYHFTDYDFDYQRSVFIKGKLQILASSSCFQSVIDDVTAQQLVYEDFKVIYLKNESNHLDYQFSLNACRQVAEPIDGTVSMRDPKTVFALTKINDVWYFGIYENQQVWTKHLQKPNSYSHSLDTRLARSLVNIAIGRDLSCTVIDPCCGVGTVVLEGCSMGVDIHGCDINQPIVEHAQQNLSYYGYQKTLVECQDMTKQKQTYQATILDIPYGIYTPFSYEQQMTLLRATLTFAPKLVLVTHIDMKSELIALGYHIQSQATIMKGSLQRIVTLCQRI